MKNKRAIIICPYDPRWPDLYERERLQITLVCSAWLAGIEHFGSTSVPGLAAKPTIDIMLGVKGRQNADKCINALQAAGYSHLPGFFFKLPGRFDLVIKNNQETRLVNLHIAEHEGPMWKKDLLFRDYLRENPKDAQAYQDLKEKLAKKYLDDIDGYTQAKTHFINAVHSRL